jgi:hypothetical protein
MKNIDLEKIPETSIMCSFNILLYDWIVSARSRLSSNYRIQ